MLATSALSGHAQDITPACKERLPEVLRETQFTAVIRARVTSRGDIAEIKAVHLPSESFERATMQFLVNCVSGWHLSSMSGNPIQISVSYNYETLTSLTVYRTSLQFRDDVWIPQIEVVKGSNASTR